MPIDINSTIRKTSSYVFGSPLLNSILGSSLFLAGVISFVMILLVMIMYPAKRGSGFSIVCKMFLYMFGISLIVIFLHDGVLRYSIEEDLDHKSNEDFMRNTTMAGRQGDAVYGVGYVPINPIQQPMQMQMQMQQPILQQSNVVVKGGQPTAAPVIQTMQPVISIAEGGSGYLGGGKPPTQERNPYAL